MTFYLVTVGRVKEPFLQEGCRVFSRRLRPYARVIWKTVDEEPLPQRLPRQGPRSPASDAVLAREGQRLLKVLDGLPGGTRRVALDLKGRSMTSEKLAAQLEDWAVSGHSAVAWIVGGTLGLDARVLESAHLRLSLSPLTFPHQWVPLILLEQLYRAFRIRRGEPYHY